MKLMIEINDIIPKNDHERYILSHGTPIPKGHWNIIGHNCIKCNQCGFERDYYNQSKYCPNCGARMVEPQESEDK